MSSDNNSDNYQIYTFPNGIRLIHCRVNHTKIAHCGFSLEVGSRDEKDHQEGIAHFWEHMAFKGTQKRKAFHIINRLDAVGGELNAFTTKEKIVFYASVLDEHSEKAIDILSDIVFRSVFPDKEIEKERGVILEEMAMYKDNPVDLLDDEFDEVVFGNHTLGKQILGTSESVKRFKRTDFEEFVAQNLDTSRLVFSSVSRLPFEKVKKMVEKYIADIPASSSTLYRNSAPFVKAQHIIKPKSISQAHCMIGGTAYNLHDKKRIPFALLNNYLGGPALNSRLNLSLREKYGLVYSVDSGFSAYSDSGMFAISFATEKKSLDKSLNLVLKQLDLLKEKTLGSGLFHTAKQQFKGQIAMSSESNSGLMIGMGKSFLDFGRMISLQEFFDEIDALTIFDLQDIAQEIFREENLHRLIYMPDGTQDDNEEN
jgi:predicted Zn-dependent peptidase